jgi:hypothetical protein
MAPDFVLSVRFGAVPEIMHHREPGMTPQYGGNRQRFVATRCQDEKKAPAALARPGLSRVQFGRAVSGGQREPGVSMNAGEARRFRRYSKKLERPCAGPAPTGLPPIRPVW